MGAYGGKELAAAFRTVRGNTLKIAGEIPAERYDFVEDGDESAPLRAGTLREASIHWAAAKLLRRFADAQVSLRQALAGSGPEEVVLDPADRERLRALGYVD